MLRRGVPPAPSPCWAVDVRCTSGTVWSRARLRDDGAPASGSTPSLDDFPRRLCKRDVSLLPRATAEAGVVGARLSAGRQPAQSN